MGPGRDRTRDPWICSQTRICCQTRYRLRYAAWSIEFSWCENCMHLLIKFSLFSALQERIEISLISGQEVRICRWKVYGIGTKKIHQSHTPTGPLANQTKDLSQTVYYCGENPTLLGVIFHVITHFIIYVRRGKTLTLSATTYRMVTKTSYKRQC